MGPGDVIRFDFSFFDTMSTRDDRMRTGVAGRRLPKGVTPVGTAFEGLFRGGGVDGGGRKGGEPGCLRALRYAAGTGGDGLRRYG